jgi:predicted dehydrogenase
VPFLLKKKHPIAILGTGGVAEAHLKSLNKSGLFTPVLIFGKNKKRLREISKKFEVPMAASLEEVLSHPDVKVVDISTSNNLHFSYAQKCLNAGKSVILEKPVAFYSGEVRQLAEICHQKKLAVNVCFQKRFNKSFIKAKKMISQNKLGKFIKGEVVVQMPRKSEYYTRPQRNSISISGGGALIYQAIHDLDLINEIFKDLQIIECRAENHIHQQEVEDTAYLKLQTAGSGEIHFFTTTDPKAKSVCETQLIFEKGQITFNNFECKQGAQKDNIALFGPKKPNSLTQKVLNRFYFNLGNYRNITKEMDYFLRGGDSQLTCSVESTIRTHELIEEFYTKTRQNS